MNVSAHCFNRQRAMAKAACFKIVFVFSVTGETEPSKLKCLCVRTASPWDWGLRVCRGELFTMRYFCGATASAHLTQSVDLFRRVRAVRSWRSGEETSLALLSRPVQAECALKRGFFSAGAIAVYTGSFFVVGALPYIRGV